MSSKDELNAQLEAILFAAGDPIGVERLCLGLNLTRPEVDERMDKLIAQYESAQGGLRIVRMNASYQMCSAPEFAGVVREVLETRAPPKLSQPALEVLAIIAYHQPTTRAYVDQVRGVDSTYTIGVLLERGLLEECGKLKEMPGRPTLYRTTDVFLRSFHLENLSELPDLGQPEPVAEQLSIQQRLDEMQEPESEMHQERFL